MSKSATPRGMPVNAANREPDNVPSDDRARRRKKQLVTWRLADIRQLPGQPRVFFDPTAMAELQTSIERRGLKVPLDIWLPADLAPGTAELIDGDRRFQCLNNLGITECDVLIRYPRDREEAIDWSEEANENRAPHSPMEMAWRYRRRLERGDTVDDIAACFGVSSQTVDNYAILTQLHPSLQELISRYGREREVLPLTRARRLARYEAAVQLEIWRTTQKFTAARFEAYMRLRDAGGHGLAEGRRVRPKNPARIRDLWLERLLKCADHVDAFGAEPLEEIFPDAGKNSELTRFESLFADLIQHIERVRARLAKLKGPTKK